MQSRPKRKIVFKKFPTLQKKIKTQRTADTTMTQKPNTDNGLQGRWTNTTGYNSTYPKGGFSCSKDSFVVAESSFLRMKFSGKNPALRVAAERYASGLDYSANRNETLKN